MGKILSVLGERTRAFSLLVVAIHSLRREEEQPKDLGEMVDLIASRIADFCTIEKDYQKAIGSGTDFALGGYRVKGGEQLTDDLAYQPILDATQGMIGVTIPNNLKYLMFVKYVEETPA